MTGRDDNKRNDAMPEFTIETPALRQALATALAFAATDGMTPAIDGVHIKPADEGVIELAATDRYVLLVEPLDVIEGGTPFEFTAPTDVVKQLLTVLPRPKRGTLLDSMVTFAKDGERVTVRLVGDVETAITFTPPDEKFINYRELLDKIAASRDEPSGVLGFRPEILARVSKALAARREGAMRMCFRGPRTGVLVTQASLTALVMPCMLPEQMDAPGAEVAA
jgi:hypothetical protein